MRWEARAKKNIDNDSSGDFTSGKNQSMASRHENEIKSTTTHRQIGKNCAFGKKAARWRPFQFEIFQNSLLSVRFYAVRYLVSRIECPIWSELNSNGVKKDSHSAHEFMNVINVYQSDRHLHQTRCRYMKCDSRSRYTQNYSKQPQRKFIAAIVN